MSEEIKLPESFDESKHVKVDEIIVCLKRSDKGPMLYLKPLHRLELINALGELQIAITNAILSYDAERARNNKPNGTIIQAARNRLFGKK